MPNVLVGETPSPRKSGTTANRRNDTGAISESARLTERSPITGLIEQQLPWGRT
jgi:hypothetical protein